MANDSPRSIFLLLLFLLHMCVFVGVGVVVACVFVVLLLLHACVLLLGCVCGV